MAWWPGERECAWQLWQPPSIDVLAFAYQRSSSFNPVETTQSCLFLVLFLLETFPSFLCFSIPYLKFQGQVILFGVIPFVCVGPSVTKYLSSLSGEHLGISVAALHILWDHWTMLLGWQEGTTTSWVSKIGNLIGKPVQFGLFYIPKFHIVICF